MISNVLNIMIGYWKIIHLKKNNTIDYYHNVLIYNTQTLYSYNRVS